MPDAILFPGDREGYILVVDKAAQVLHLYHHDARGQLKLERTMRCSSGINKGDKMIEGDKKTPNGFYVFNQKLLPRELSPIYGTLAYPTDYPNFWDKKLGRGGYGIWLHGINKPLINYDSNGCVELENADVARLEDLVRLFDTPIIIYEELTMAPAEELANEGRAVREFIEEWSQAWATKNHQAYREKYAPEFVNSDDRSFVGWMAHKEGVAKRYQTITVEIKDLRIFYHRDVITAVFEQDYRGDNRFTSIGLKRLYIKNTDQGYKIVGEEFRPMPGPSPDKWLTAAEKRKAIETPPLTLAESSELPTDTDIIESSEQAANEAGQMPLLTAMSGPTEEEISAAEEANLDDKAKAEEIEREIAAARKAEAEARERNAAMVREAEQQAEAEALAKAEAEKRERAEARLKAEAEEAATKKHILSVVENWAEAWRKQDIPAYFECYHPDFYYKAKKMALAEFKNYRSSLIEKSSSIGLKLTHFETRIAGDTVQVSFRQDYRSDNVQDYGRKTLTFKKIGSDWKIVSETWKALR